MRFRKPHFFQRSLHDLYASIASRCLPPVQEVDAQEISGAKSFVVQKSGEAELRHPLEEAMYGPDFASTRVSWPEITGYQLPNVHLVGDQGCAYVAGRRLRGPCAVWSPVTRKSRRPISFLSRAEPAPLFHLTGINHENRAHFILDHLPRYFASRAFHQIEAAHLLLAPGHLKWQADFLGLLGVEKSRLSEGTPGSIRADKLYLMPFLTGQNQFCDPQILQDMLKEMHANIQIQGWNKSGQSHSSAPRALWISRRDAPDRQLRNEESLVDIARNILGAVEVIRLSAFPLREQIAKIVNSEFIIGAQGQGIANTVFASAKKVIILEQGTMPSEGGGWTAIFRDMAELAGNHAIRLYSDIPLAAGKSDWEFPAEHFAAELTRLKQICEIKTIFR